MSEKPTPSFKDTAYTTIKKKILCGEIKSGELLNEKEFIKELGVSRTPVREALAKLSNEGMVDILPSRGMVVATISLDDIQMLYQTRSLIEPPIARMVAAHPDKERLENFRSRFLSLHQISFTDEGKDIDFEFHTYLAKESGNHYLLNMEEILMMKCQLVRTLSSLQIEERDNLACQEHVKIIDALLQNDGSEAESAVLEHLQKSIVGYHKAFSSLLVPTASTLTK